jgi:phospholipid transport system substrate-binding protein
LKQILFARFDFAEMAKRSLGADLAPAHAPRTGRFRPSLHRRLERAYADIIESYTNEKIVYVHEKVDGNYADVYSKIVTAKGEEYTINYKAQLAGNDWKVYDVVAENVSLVNNYRSQFTRVISKSSYEELVRRLRDKSEFTGAPKK